MASTKRTVSVAAVALLAFVCHAATRSNAEDGRTITQAITTNSINASGDDTASTPEFDGDGTVEFSDLIVFARQFGKTVSRRPTLKKRRTAGSWDKVESVERDTV